MYQILMCCPILTFVLLNKLTLCLLVLSSYHFANSADPDHARQDKKHAKLSNMQKKLKVTIDHFQSYLISWFL